MAIDISKNELYIARIENTIHNYLPTRHIEPGQLRRGDGFIYILSGSCKYRFENNISFEAKAGDVLYLSNGSKYTMDVVGKYEFICVNFLFNCEEERQSARFPSKDPGETEKLFRRILRLSNNGPGMQSDRMSLLYRIYNSIIKSRSDFYLPSSMRYKIEQANGRIFSDLGSPDLSVSALARDAGMSEVYFRKLFSEIYGISPSKYITLQRISYAQKLLDDGFLSVDEVAERCGFSSSSYFCRVFKNQLGLTPTEYQYS
jgi:AraC-like DNA-binding protein